jgi:hypothetical protein
LFYAAKSFIAAVTQFNSLMPLLEILIIFSSLFLGYGIAYFTTTNMKMNLFFDWVIWNSYCNFRNSGSYYLLSWFIVQRYFIDIAWSCFIDTALCTPYSIAL